MTKDEALDLALEAMENPNDIDEYNRSKYDLAIAAIKQARALDRKAENARELGLDYEPAEALGHNGWGFPIKAAAPVPEPVAFFDPQGKGFYWAKPTQITAPVTVDVEPLSLYTTPAAQRQWVGLTDAEVMQTMSGDWTSQFYFARAVEAKLKEKNT